MSPPSVVLGFLDDTPFPLTLHRRFFPSKVGGRPAWLIPQALPGSTPSIDALKCERCGGQMSFLLQLYCPITSMPSAFHRTLYVFTCRLESCVEGMASSCTTAISGADESGWSNIRPAIRVFRAQLPMDNPFYSNIPPDIPASEDRCDALLSSEFTNAIEEITPDVELETQMNEVDELSTCRLCGVAATSVCSRCSAVRYCCKDHQTEDWKIAHKEECREYTESLSTNTADRPPLCSTLSYARRVDFDDLRSTQSMYVFPEYEIVNEEEYPYWEESRNKDRARSSKYMAAVSNTPKSAADTEDDRDVEELCEEQTAKVATDSQYIKFTTITSYAPEQCIRYCRTAEAVGNSGNEEENDSPPYGPLWFGLEGRPSNIPSSSPLSRCSICGGPRSFEFQILPQILYVLGES